MRTPGNTRSRLILTSAKLPVATGPLGLKRRRLLSVTLPYGRVRLE